MSSTGLHHPDVRTVAQIPGYHAARRPDTTAIACAGLALTYAELHAESNRIAHALIAAGIVIAVRS